MTDIRPVPEADIPTFVHIMDRAYPGMNLDSDGIQRLTDRLRADHLEDPGITLYGAYRDGEFLGGMILYDFIMQMYETRVPLGGVGMVGVHLLHKKEKIARDMLQFYIRHYDQKAVPLLALYPFRPDFYRRMGFGYGTKKTRYEVLPAGLPRGETKAHLRYLGPEDVAAFLDCYHRAMPKTHGLFERKESRTLRRILENPKINVVGCESADGILEGYLVFSFKAVTEESFLINNIQVHEFLYHTPDALAEMFTFLHTQADQVNRIVFLTQDEYFHHLLVDPRNGSDRLIPTVYHETNTAGLGVMYRVVNTRRLFEALAGHDFGGQTLTLKIILNDSFYAPNAGSTIVRFTAGQAVLAPEATPDVTITLDVSEFSSLVMGVVPFQQLVAYGLAGISDPAYTAAVDRIFHAPAKPVCMTDF